MSKKSKPYPPPRLEIRDKLYLYVEGESSALDGDIDLVIERIAKFKQSLEEKYSSENYICFEMVVGHDYDGDFELRFNGIKLESDAQYNARLKQIDAGKRLAEANTKKRKERLKKRKLEKEAEHAANEKSEYERLKKKFENKK